MRLEVLSGAIAPCHARIEALPFFAALAAGSLPLEAYVGQLRAMAVLHGTLLHEMAMLDSGELSPFLVDRPSRLEHMRKDLSLLDALAIPDFQDALAPVARLAARIRVLRLEQPTSLLGVLYVLEGTTLGNTQHLPEVLAAFGARTAGTAHYYAGYGSGTLPRWRAFGAALAAVALDPAREAQVVQAALECFQELEALFAALHPAAGQGRPFTAMALNPEAGDHEVPQDGPTLRAALAAGTTCWAEFPYFEARFGARGRAFAASDAAWLATLAQLPATQALSQVEWLGRVLGNRGIPRLTLERQLELLQEGRRLPGLGRRAAARSWARRPGSCGGSGSGGFPSRWRHGWRPSSAPPAMASCRGACPAPES